VDPDGRLVYTVWLREDDGGNRIRYQQLDQTAATLVSLDLDLPDTQPRLPRILSNGQGGHHLVWLSRPDGRRAWDMQYVQLDLEGQTLGDIVELASAEHDVSELATVSDGQGGFYVVWQAGADGRLYGSQIDAAGALLQDSVLLVEQGTRPSLALSDGDLYLTWMDGFDVMFAGLPQGKLTLVDGFSPESIPLSADKELDGPYMGVAGDWAYVIWSMYSSSGLVAGTANTDYVAFPKDNPQRLNAQRVRIAAAEEPAYAPYESAYQITQLAPPLTSGGTDYVHEPAIAAARGDELAVAVVFNQDQRLDTVSQIAVLILTDGQLEGYQVAGKTKSFSQEPTLATDESGNLYSAWREGGQGAVTFYAVTSAEGRDAIDRFQIDDVTNLAFTGGLEMLVGILFFPLGCIWLFPGLIIIGLWHVWRGDSDLGNKATVAVLVLAIVVSQVVKIFFLPTITTYVPFSAWLEIAPRWEQPLIFLIPMVTIGAGLLVASFMRRRTSSGLAFYFWFTATDAILTLAIYGVTILGVF
jgi:hypothetical protein